MYKYYIGLLLLGLGVLAIATPTMADGTIEDFYVQFRATGAPTEGYLLDLNFNPTTEFVPFMGREYDTKHFVMLMDVSGSMAWTSYVPGKVRLQLGKDEFNSTISVLSTDEDHQFGMAYFRANTGYWLSVNLQTPTPDMKTSATTFVNSMVASGNTNLHDGLNLAKTYPNADHIFVLSDGEPTTGPQANLYQEKYAGNFTVARTLKDVLDARNIPAEISTELASKRVILPADASVTVITDDSKWQITSPGMQGSILIEKQRNNLKVTAQSVITETQPYFSTEYDTSMPWYDTGNGFYKRYDNSYESKVLEKVNTDPGFANLALVMVWIGENNDKAKGFMRKVANDFPTTDPRFNSNRKKGVFDDKSVD